MLLPLLIVMLSSWIAGGTWRREPDMLVARAAHAVVAGADATYALAGRGADGTPLDVERFDGTRWTRETMLPAPRGGHAVAVLDGRIHVLGGGNSQSTLDLHTVYDPRVNAWSERAPGARVERDVLRVWDARRPLEQERHHLLSRR